MSTIMQNQVKSNPIRHISPYTKGTTLNKMANMFVQAMQNSSKSFDEIYRHSETQRIIATHNQGEFRHYPPTGKAECFKELLKLAVGKKLGTVIR
jgi:hypothetical protein